MNKALAHISIDGTRTQTVYEHLSGTAHLAGAFAAAFGAQQEAEYAAWLHDIGKYSAAFQQRLGLHALRAVGVHHHQECVRLHP